MSQYIHCDEQIWRYTNKEFKRQLQKIIDGGQFDLNKGTTIIQGYGNQHRLENMSADHAQYLLDEMAHTKKEEGKTDE